MADESQEPVDWTGVTEKMARQILAQGELFLQAQLQLAIAADQRATTAASIFASTATAVAAAFIAFWDTSHDVAALRGGLSGALVLLAAAACAAWAARPTAFDAPGNHPNQWFGGRKDDLVTMIGGEAESVQRRITRNDEVLGGNRLWLVASFISAGAAPIVALWVWHCAA